MTRVEADPPTRPAGAPLPFVQRLQMTDDVEPIGHATWTTGGDGIVQLLELSIQPHHRRRGLGRHLFRSVADHAKTYHRSASVPLRRIWATVGHKRHVVGRAFLTGEGFHLLASTSGLYADEDLLIYVKSFD